MGLELSLEIKGLEEIQASLEEIQAKKLQDFSPLAQTIRGIFLEDQRNRFESSPQTNVGGTVYGGVYWKPHKKPNRKGKILIDSHTLERSLTVEGDGGNIFEVNGTEILFGSNIPYAERQDKDRPFLFWHPSLLEKVSKAIASWLVEDL